MMPAAVMLAVHMATAAAPPFVPWVVVAHETMAMGHPASGNTAVPLLGTFAAESACRERCAAQPNCTMYVWNNASSPEWYHRCYGRHDTLWELHASPDSYSGRRVDPEPLPPVPPAPPPAPPVPPGVLSLQVLSGVPLDPHLFGWNMESWGQDINLTDDDSAGLALTSALHTGVLRYPGESARRWPRMRCHACAPSLNRC